MLKFIFLIQACSVLILATNLSDLIVFAGSEQPVLSADLEDNDSKNTPSLSPSSSCNCVIFRLDDIQDYYENKAQEIIMDLFLSKNQSLTLGVIMNFIGKDPKIVEKVTDGTQSGLFELAVHGWDHNNYTEFNKTQQKNFLLRANEKMESLFGNRSSVFIPPLNEFNLDTINSMGELGYNVLSAGRLEEFEFDGFDSISIIDNKKGMESDKANREGEDKRTAVVVNHLPSWVSYKAYVDGIWQKNDLHTILGRVNESIDHFGYAVITLHPTDVLKQHDNGTLVEGEMDANELNDLAQVIDTLVSNGFKITSFDNIIKKDNVESKNRENAVNRHNTISD